MAEIAPTRSAALALVDERALMRQGYDFLDEKRMLLAARLLRELEQHARERAELARRVADAATALRAALRRHGLDALQAQAHPPPPAPPEITRSGFLGVTLQQLAQPMAAAGAAPAPVDASPELDRCREAFAALLAPLTAAAVSAGNLERLAAEYRRTERRALALENVLLPEVDRTLARIEDQLELADQEEAVRIRIAASRRR